MAKGCRGRCAAVAALLPAALAAPTLTVNTTTLTHLAGLRVTLSGLEVSKSYWMGVFYPANASVDPRTPMPYPATAPWTTNAAAKYTPNFNSTTTTYDFVMINSFEDAKIWLFEGTIEKFTAAASTPTLTFADLNAPLRGHIHRTTDPSQMRVLWNSRNDNDNPAVKWGTAPGAYTGVAYAESATYAASDLCGDPAQTHGWFTPHFWQNALITGLKPSTVYYYVYGSDANGWSAEASFISAPPRGADQAVNILACADLGVTNPDATLSHWNEPSATLTTQHMAAEALGSGSGYDYSLLLHSGDISYATGYQLKWDLFASEVTATGLGLRVPYMINQGNHERDFPGTGTFFNSSDSGGECGIATQTRFWSATQTSHMQDQGWYGFAHGNVYIIMIGTEFEVGPGSDQYDFMEQTLAGIDRSVTPWVVLMGHRPMYYVDDNAAGGTLDTHFQAFESLLMKYKVDLVAWGHVHNAFASCPVYNGTCVTPASPGAYTAPIHVCIGNAGQTITPINEKKQPDWVEWQMAEWGWSNILVHNATHLTMNFFQDSDNSLQHTFTIVRTFPRT